MIDYLHFTVLVTIEVILNMSRQILDNRLPSNRLLSNRLSINILPSNRIENNALPNIILLAVSELWDLCLTLLLGNQLQ